MKNFSKEFFILTSALFILAALTPIAFGQATSITEEEFDRARDKALQTAKTTFPRRETESEPNRIEVFLPVETKPVETILNISTIIEFLAKDKIRYEFRKVTAKGIISTVRIEIGAFCYDESSGEKWATFDISCDQKVYSVSMPPAKREFFVENATLGAKTVKIFRAIEIGRVYTKGESPYINEYLFYLDAAGWLVKSEYLQRKGEEKPNLESVTIYEYDVKIKPISVPDAGKKAKNAEK